MKQRVIFLGQQDMCKIGLELNASVYVAHFGILNTAASLMTRRNRRPQKMMTKRISSVKKDFSPVRNGMNKN